MANLHTSHSNTAATSLDHLLHEIEHVAHLLPSQGPIAVFVHHNTLHPFEGLVFEDAVLQGSAAFHCQPYLSEDRYHAHLKSGRIQVADVEAILRKDLGDESMRMVGPDITRLALRLNMLKYPLRTAQDVELRWILAESDALRKFRSDADPALCHQIIEETKRWIMRDMRNGHDHPTRREQHLRQMVDSIVEHFGPHRMEQWTTSTWESLTLSLLWQICRQGVHGLPTVQETLQLPIRHRDLLLATCGEDADRFVNDLIIRFTGSFLDQGLSHWALPHRELGFFRCFCKLFSLAAGSPARWTRSLSSELNRIVEQDLSPLQVIAESLAILGVNDDEREAFIAQTFLALPGWAGMVCQMETNAEWTMRPAPRGSLVEFLAVRLLLDRLAAMHIAQDSLDLSCSLAELRGELKKRIAKPHVDRINQRAYAVFQLAQVCGWKPEALSTLSHQEWGTLVEEIECFEPMERRRVLHLAFERRYRQNALDAIASHQPFAFPPETIPSFQLVTCIDDREESLRRHIEEVDPNCETFGAAGFFSVPIYYRGVADAHYVPLCPIVIKPQHYVQEEVAYTLEQSHTRRANTRRRLGNATHRIHVGSRSFLAGAFTSLAGSLASIPLVARVLFPHTTARVRRIFGRLVQPPQLTQLHLQRSLSPPSPEEGHRGFTLQEMANMVERLLRDIGLTKNFSELLVIVGHGSSSLNNPHESAYNCGACGGGRGGPNARAFASMANDPRVRRQLLQQGLDIPPETYVVGAYHNTCDDSISFFDLDRLPLSHRTVFSEMRRVLERARERNAHERSRRFELAPLNSSPEAALRHVEERSEDLSQARPEYNHATCAACFVGRRSRVRGLFLDRRCFLTSYDPTQDTADHTILARILGAVIPVCAGISLEYYFSCVDPSGWGCGSKLPHNITSLLGVMEGAASDLRTGLSAQMVEIHEPLRILFIIETTPEAMLKIIDANPTIKQLCHNRWVQLSVLDPHSQSIHVFEGGTFKPHTPITTALPKVANSLDWYRGWRDHLGFAEIEANVENSVPHALRLHPTSEVRSP